MHGPQRHDRSVAIRVGAVGAALLAISIVVAVNGLPRSAPAVNPGSGPSTHMAQIAPATADASSELTDFHAAHLLDGDPASQWRTIWRDGAEIAIRFAFERPVELSGVELQSPGATGRIRSYEVHVGNGPPVRGELDQRTLSHWLPLPQVATDQLVLHITDAYVAPSSDGAPVEVSLAEVRFFAAPS